MAFETTPDIKLVQSADYEKRPDYDYIVTTDPPCFQACNCYVEERK